MFSVYRTLSLRHLTRRWFRAVLIIASISLGVATLVATRTLNDTMSKAALTSANPMAGVADFVVSQGELTLSRGLVKELAAVPGVKSVRPFIFRKAYLTELHKDVLVVGLDFLAILNEFHAKDKEFFKISEDTFNKYIGLQATALFGDWRQIPVIVGKTLDDEIPPRTIYIRVQKDKDTREQKDKDSLEQKDKNSPKVHKLVYTGPLEAFDKFAVLGGYTLVLDLANAAQVLGMQPDQVNRIDIGIDPSADHEEVRSALEKTLRNRALLTTPDEHNQAQQSAMAGMQTGFALCGVAALVVGLFLVYNSLSVTIAERRHEIGILLAMGATRLQVVRIYTAEAATLGIAGALVGLPLGWGLATLGLGPMQDIVGSVFGQVQTPTLELDAALLGFSAAAGILTSVLACLKPVIEACCENPAEAVRRVAKAPTAHHLIVQVATSATMIVVGTLLILIREHLPYRLGTYGGLMLVLVGALVASPFFAALGARLIQPLARRYLGIEWRLAADNLVRSPGRTGLVIGALAAGVCLVVQTTGTINSNKRALRDWVQDTFSADLIVTSGGPVSAGQTQDMEESLGAELRKLPGIDVDVVLPLRMVKVPFRDTQIYLNALEAGQVAQMEKKRGKPKDNDLFQQLHDQPDSVIVSENFAALYRVKKGDTITLTSKLGPVTLKVIGQMVDYTWNHGSLILDRRDFKKHWGDDKVTVFDVYLKNDDDLRAAKVQIDRYFGAQHQLHAMTRDEVQNHIDDLIERLYGIAYGQQIVVMLVAALGVLTALLISVLQRRREMGMLRAIGASRVQVIYSVLAEACLMGIIGTVIGVLVGVPLQWYVLQVVILEESGYLFPVYIPWTGALVIAAAAMLTATLAGLGPALHSVRQRIPEAIAYE